MPQYNDALDPNHQISVTPDSDFVQEYSKMSNDDALKESDDVDPYFNDEYLSITLGVPRGPDNNLHYATVKKWAVDKDGVPIGKPHTNIHMDSRQYEVEFLDGST